MIPKSGNRFSEKIMLKQKARVGCRFNSISSRSRSSLAQAQDVHERMSM
jgi:hypothetical protein